MFIQSTNTKSIHIHKRSKIVFSQVRGSKLNPFLDILPRTIVAAHTQFRSQGVLENSFHSPCFPKLLFIRVRYLRDATDVTALSRRKSESPSAVLDTRSDFPLYSPAKNK
jgi:hypothetical protein